MIRFSVFALFVLGILCRGTAAPEPVRIAVIGDAGSKDLAALITAELSTAPEIKLVEREELAKAGDELKLQQMAGADAVALGKVVNADGLLFIDRRQDSYQIRFTGVGLGYVLFDEQISTEIALPQLVKSIIHRVSGYAPKLKLDPAKAIPISVLNLRADYATTESAALERNLTLLLEERLAAIPEFIVLERRHSWSLGLERNLAPETHSLLKGTYLIDGSLGLSSSSKECKVALRLRRPEGAPVEISITAGVDKLPSLAGRVVGEIQKNVSLQTSTSPAASIAEAMEYFAEGVWAWRSNSPQAAVEALDSAELLGGPLPDITAVRNYALCAVTEKDIENYYPSIGDPSTIPKLDEASMTGRTEAALRAIRDMVRFRDENFAGKLRPKTTEKSIDEYYFRNDQMRARTITRCSKLLFLLDSHHFPRADELRQALRLITEYDPLHGKPGLVTDANMNNYIARSYFAGTWAKNMEEELAFYSLVCNDKDVALPTDIEKRFCFRFLKTGTERMAKYEEFIASLPETADYRFSKLLLQTRLQDRNSANEAGAKLLASFWEQRKDLPKNGKIYGMFHIVPPGVKIANGPKSAQLLQFLLTSPDIDWRGLGILHDFWVPTGFRDEDAPALWKAFLQCKGNLKSIWQSKGFNMSHLDRHLYELEIMETDFRRKFPEVATLPASKPAAIDPSALTVRKFWSPWQLPDIPEGSCSLFSWSVSDDGVWVIGVFGVENIPRIFFHVNLTNFITQKVDRPNDDNPMEIVATPEALYMLSDPLGNSEKKSLWRYDLKSSFWESHALPDFIRGDLFEVSGNLYFFTQATSKESSIVRYDWITTEWKILASSRRRPAKNQFDDSAPVVFRPTIFAGPNGSPCVTFLEGTYYIREEDGPWPEVFNGAWGQYSRSIGDRTLIGSQNGEVIMLSSKNSEPELITACYQAKFRKRGPTKDTVEKIPTPWKAQNPWELDFGKNSSWNEHIGFRDGDIYMLEVPDGENPLFLLYYRSGDSASPYRIPLRFQLDEATKATLSALPEKCFPYNFNLEHIENPEKMPPSLKNGEPSITTTHQGLCIRYRYNGFWFLPFEDIDDWLKEHPKAP